jgi:hypothetical protein
MRLSRTGTISLALLGALALGLGGVGCQRTPNERSRTDAAAPGRSNIGTRGTTGTTGGTVTRPESKPDMTPAPGGAPGGTSGSTTGSTTGGGGGE